MRIRLQYPAAHEGQIIHHHTLPRAAPHRHTELEFIFMVAGTMPYVVGSRRFTLQRHDLLWLFPGQDHGVLHTSKDAEFYVAVFHPRLLRRVWPVLRQRNPPGNFLRRLPEPAADQLHQLVQEVEESASDAVLFNAGLLHVLTRAWQVFQTTPEEPRGSELHPAVEKALGKIKSARGSLEIEEIARAASLSYSRLSRLFKQQTGVTIVGFCHRQKVARFRELYGAGQRFTILQAALEAGFGSYPTFHRVFRQITGLSPARYRLQVRGLERHSTAGALRLRR